MFEQERLIGRIQRRVAQEPNILASFLSGSFGRRADDPYSDLDLALVYGDEGARAKAWRGRVELTQSIMPYVPFKSFDAEHIRPYFHVVLFANGSKLDLRFDTQDSSIPNPWDGQIRILKDTDGWARSHQASSEQQAFPQPAMSHNELIALDQRCWVMYWDVLRLLARGDSDKPFPIYLELLHFALPPLLQALPATAKPRTNLIQAVYSRDATVTAQHMAVLLETYVAARSAVVTRYHLQFFPDKSFESQIQRLVARLT
jgi:hypothetical protein